VCVCVCRWGYVTEYADPTIRISDSPKDSDVVSTKFALQMTFEVHEKKNENETNYETHYVVLLSFVVVVDVDESRSRARSASPISSDDSCSRQT
jgi:hypothetical protein